MSLQKWSVTLLYSVLVCSSLACDGDGGPAAAPEPLPGDAGADAATGDARAASPEAGPTAPRAGHGAFVAASAAPPAADGGDVADAGHAAPPAPPAVDIDPGSADEDRDHDGLTTEQERMLGTDPRYIDTDLDSIGDGE